VYNKQVRVANLTFDLGYLEYEERVAGTGGLSEIHQIIIGVCVAAFFIIVFIIVMVLVVRFKRQSSKTLRENRQLMAQLDALEISVRDQCKQGQF